jgi:alkaline phosphatase
MKLPVSALCLLLAATSATAAEPPQASDAYYRRAQAQLETVRAAPVRPQRAKNVILVVGDGMGLSTVTAARIATDQRQSGRGATVLSFERLPQTALARTYAHNAWVTDSAAGITGLMSGVKTNNGVIGLDARAKFDNCASAQGADATSIAELAKAKGLSVGVVTNTRITDATPAGVYGHTPAREWEDDSALPPEAVAQGCRDMASQLTESLARGGVDVAFGGGRARFQPDSAGGRRADGKDLLGDWAAGGAGRRLVSTGAELKALDLASARQVVGLFGPDNLPYRLSRDAVGLDVPSLPQMVEAALTVLSRNPRGYFLLVEGGMIDKASHMNNAARTLDETEELSEAVDLILKRVDLSNTLVIVTADHSHGLVISGGGDFEAPEQAKDGKPYPTLSFATGPGAEIGPRRDLTGADLQDLDFIQPALVPMASAEHSGEDVAVYADGPGSQWIRGVVEQPYVFQVMRKALALN